MYRVQSESVRGEALGGQSESVYRLQTKLFGATEQQTSKCWSQELVSFFKVYLELLCELCSDIFTL